MQNFIKTILSGVQAWTKGKIKESITSSTADWNQNDPSADNYVKNRTHWEEENRVTLVNNLTFFDYDSGNAPQCNFVPGQKYDVIWNGVLYEGLVCWFDGEYNIIASPDNGCPFYIDDDGGDDLYISSDDDDNNWVVSIIEDTVVIHKLDSKYLDLPTNLATTDDVQEAVDVANEAYQIADNVSGSKMDANNPVGTGSFSMNRDSSSVIGTKSIALGTGTIASGTDSIAIGRHAQAATMYSFAIGDNVYTEGQYGVSIGKDAVVTGISAVAIGADARADGDYSVAIGRNSISSSERSIAIGQSNIEDTNNKYALIIGNGIWAERSNAHTLDWNGVGWFQGGLQVGGNAQDDGAKNVLLEGDAIPIPENAIVGQTIAVKSVDENGKPVEWEATNFSASGGSGCVASDTAPEDTSVLWIDTSDNSGDQLPDADLTGYATEQWVEDQNYLTEVPEGYAKTSEIPTDDHINSLINTALGVIENGTY